MEDVSGIVTLFFFLLTCEGVTPRFDIWSILNALLLLVKNVVFDKFTQCAKLLLNFQNGRS